MPADKDSLTTTEDSSAVEDSPPPLVGGPVGFPLAFALIWPIMRVVIVPLLFRVLPVLLRRIADALDRGEPIVSAKDIMDLVEDQRGAMQKHYEGHQP